MDDDNQLSDDQLSGDGGRLAADRARDEAIVARIRDGEPDAFGELYDAWFDRSCDLATRITRSPEAGAEVAQEVFVTAWTKLDTLRDAASFGGWLLRITRNRALDRLARDRRSVAVDDEALGMIEQANRPEERLAHLDDPAAVAGDQELVDLVWEAAGALGERDLTVLDLQLRHGLGPAEIGEVMDLNRNAANQLVHRVKGRLGVAIRARMLWRGGRPSCERLAASLADAGVTRFGPEALAVIDRHLGTCDACDDRARTAVAPAALFAALPMVAPSATRHQVALALADAGVPMGGSASLAGASRPRSSTTRALVAVAALVVMLLAAVGAATVLDGGEDRTVDTDGGQAAASDPAAPDDPVAEDLTGSSSTATSSASASVPATAPIEGGSTTGDPRSGSTTTSRPIGAPPTTADASGPSEAPGPTIAPGPVPTSEAPPATTVPPPPATTTTTSAPPPTIGFSLAPPSHEVTTGWTSGSGSEPRLTWSVGGATRVVVSGAGVSVDSLARTNHRFCPNGLAGSVCNAAVGDYVYTLTAYGSSGQVLATRTVTLTVQPQPG